MFIALCTYTQNMSRVPGGGRPCPAQSQGCADQGPARSRPWSAGLILGVLTRIFRTFPIYNKFEANVGAIHSKFIANWGAYMYIYIYIYIYIHIHVYMYMSMYTECFQSARWRPTLPGPIPGLRRPWPAGLILAVQTRMCRTFAMYGKCWRHV